MIVAAFIALAAIGAVARWQLSRLNSLGWPTGTLAANLSAAFVLGLVHDSSPDTLTLVGGALLGSYSTFSTVILEVVGEAESRQLGRAWLYLGATVTLGIGAAGFGVWLG